MENENVNVTNEQQEQNDAQYYLNVIKDMKANSVPKAKYDKLEQTHKEFVQSYANGETPATAGSELPEKSLEELWNEFRHPEHPLSNVEYVTKALEYRDRLLEETGEDCFVSKGHNIHPTADSYISAQRAADVYRECLELANGDSETFTAALLSRMVENPMANITTNKNRR